MTPEQTQYLYAALTFFGTMAVAWEGGRTKAFDVAKGLWAAVTRKTAPATTPGVSGSLDALLAQVRLAQIEALSKPVDVRTAILAECDSFMATARALYAEMAK
jgi:hypothetical protein